MALQSLNNLQLSCNHFSHSFPSTAVILNRVRGHLTNPLKNGLSLKLAVVYNPGSIQVSLSQAKADPSIAWARLPLFPIHFSSMLNF